MEEFLNVTHSRIQHGVGQGSFHSATVELITDDGTRYRYDYVYDCGGLNGKYPSPALLRSIARLDLEPRVNSRGTKVIDALVLSHYDYDHLAGAEILASRFEVRRIIAPYLSTEELMLVISSQALALTERQVSELHQLASGASGGLFGVPVTQILSGSSDGDGGQGNPDGSSPPHEDDHQEDAYSKEDPESMQTVMAGSGSPMGATLTSGDTILLADGSKSITPWRLKFWNRGTSHRLIRILSVELKSCGFPVGALRDANHIPVLIRWLGFSQNRKATLAAYRRAIAAYQPSWMEEAGGGRLANFLSLGLYSGPAFRVQSRPCYTVLSSNNLLVDHRASDRWHRRYSMLYHSPDKTGWLGTGDAPLGEPAIWTDFKHCYEQELENVLTVQIPHHGAAPSGGPRFFNVNLLPEDDMCAVVSAGTNNNYGHPTSQVIRQILSRNAFLEIVTEQTWLGFQEIIRY